VNAADIESRHIERAVVSVDGQEGAIRSVARRVEHRLTLALESFEIGEAHVAVRIRRGAEHRQSVAADDIDRHACHRRARRDRLHEHILRAVDRTLHEQAEVGDDDEPRIAQLSARRIPVIAQIDDWAVVLRIPRLYA
jgi:hypothetical protein